MSDKRTDYISWDEYFMGVAKLAAMRSKDPSTQVGACIVDKDNYILSVGYNGFPIGCDDEEPKNQEPRAIDADQSPYHEAEQCQLYDCTPYGDTKVLEHGAFQEIEQSCGYHQQEQA